MGLLTDEEFLRHGDTVGVRVVFARPVGEALRREWTWREVFSGRAPSWLFSEPPPFLRQSPDPEFEWHRDPRGWAEFRGAIKDGRVDEHGPLWEDVARAWLWPERR